jgi:hypothetical protein
MPAKITGRSVTASYTQQNNPITDLFKIIICRNRCPYLLGFSNWQLPEIMTMDLKVALSSLIAH